MAQQPQWAKSSSLPQSDTPHSVDILWTSDQPDAETSTWQHTTDKTSPSPAGFEPAIPISERPQTHALDRAVTGTGRALLFFF